MTSRVLGVLCLSAFVVAACAATSEGTDDHAAVGEERDNSIIASIPVAGPDQTADPASFAPVGYDHAATELLDVRGLGDSAFAVTHEKDPMPAQIGDALDRFDPSGLKIKGDLTFVNWETVVGNHCDQFSKPYVAGSSYAFLSRPENLGQLYARGVNLIGLSNNHSRDCSNGGGEDTSSKMSTSFLDTMNGNEWLWAGIAEQQADVRVAKVRTFTIKGKPVKVAFGDLYTGRGTCPLATCQDDANALMASLRDADADIRILALHSQDSQPALVNTGTAFIQQYNGDVVMGHGPHVWMPVRVLEKKNGGKGVFFESLGNFLHPGCGVQAKNFIGRALFDTDFKLKQVQLVPVMNTGKDVKLSSANPAEVPANLHWTATGKDGAVYANIKP